MDPRPRATQARGVLRLDAEALECDPASALRRHTEPQDFRSPARDVDGPRRVLLVLELDLEPRSGGGIAHGDLEFGALAGEDRRSSQELDRGAEQIVVTVLHDDE